MYLIQLLDNAENPGGCSVELRFLAKPLQFAWVGNPVLTVGTKLHVSNVVLSIKTDNVAITGKYFIINF